MFFVVKCLPHNDELKGSSEEFNLLFLLTLEKNLNSDFLLN